MAPSVKGFPWDWPLSSFRILCAPCPHYQLPMAPVKTSSVSSTDQGMLFSGYEAEWNGNTGDPTMHTVFRVAAEWFMLSPKLPPPKKAKSLSWYPPCHWSSFNPSNYRCTISIQWGKMSKNTCHVDRTIAWLNFSFFNLLLCCQTQLQCKVLAAGGRFHFSNSCFCYFLFSPPQTDSPLAKRNILSANIDLKDYAIYILMQRNKSHYSSLRNYRPGMFWGVFFFFFAFSLILFSLCDFSK